MNRFLTGLRAALVAAAVHCALFAALGGPARADDPRDPSPDQPQQSKPQDLSQLGIEDLMKIQVTTASKQAQPLSAVPAAVYVITQEDIRRAGATTIADALRMAPGVEVAQIDANKWAISIRGFNNRFADKLLVLIDGRSVYTPLFAGVYWDMQDTLIEDIDRIEVVRGPGAALWGANAMNGVINIITKSAKETQGSLATITAGTVRRGEAAYRLGGRLSDNAHFRLFGKAFGVQDSLYPDSTRGKDGWDSLRGGFRVDWDRGAAEKLLFEGEVAGDKEGQRSDYPTLVPPYIVTRDETYPASAWHLLGRWTRTAASGAETSLQAYFSHDQRNSIETFYALDTFDFDLQHRFAAGRRTTLTTGLGFRHEADRTETNPFSQYTPAAKTDALWSAFVHSETAVSPTASLILGARIEHNDYTGFEIQPDARIAWSPDSRSTLWSAVSHAVRTPSRVDADGRLFAFSGPDPQSGLPYQGDIVGNAAFRSEEVTAFQLGYRIQPVSRATVDLAAFYNDYSHLRTFEMGAPAVVMAPAPHLYVPYLTGNSLYGQTHGLELALNWNVSDRWSLKAGYTYFESNLKLAQGSTDPLGINGPDGRGQNPRHQFNIRSHVALGGKVELDANVYFVDSLPYQSVPQYARMDLRLGWSPRKGVEASLGAQNLFGAPHKEFSSSLYEDPALMERSVYGKLNWRF
jgi:iron complex outermembrane receptor protein